MTPGISERACEEAIECALPGLEVSIPRDVDGRL